MSNSVSAQNFLALRARAALFENMQFVLVLENITFCSLFTNRLRLFGDFNHHSNQHQPPLPLLIGDMRCSSLSLSVFVPRPDRVTSLFGTNDSVFSLIRPNTERAFFSYFWQNIRCIPPSVTHFDAIEL